MKDKFSKTWGAVSTVPGAHALSPPHKHATQDFLWGHLLLKVKNGPS